MFTITFYPQKKISNWTLLYYYHILQFYIQFIRKIDNKIDPMQYRSRPNYFQENFEESEANFDDGAYQPVAYGNPASSSQGVYNQNDELPIQLVQFKPSGDMELNEGALELINTYNKPVGFVCLAGKYRTGKSFLLNKLLNLRGSGFKVDASTTACTQGIWMWSKPIFSPKEDCYLFFIDTEGSDSTNRNSDHDARIFTVAILISSYFIFNSVGAIDEMSISQLNLVTTLSKKILVGDSRTTTEDALHHYMPKFLWLLRDFILELKDQNGKRLSPPQYLQSCLLDQNTQIRASETTKNVRRALVNYFKERDCMVLVRPAQDEADLKNLAALPEARLRREFIEGVRQLKQKILANAVPKTINGQPVNSLMFTELLRNYVETINHEGIPNITSAWEHISEQAGVEAYDAAIGVYKDAYSKHFAVDEPKGEQIHGILKDMRDEAMETFDTYLQAPNQRFRNKLKNYLLEKQQAILKVNDDCNRERNLELLKELSAPLMRNLELGKYKASNAKVLTQDMNEMIARYNANAKGQNKCDVLSEFLASFNPMLLNSYTTATNQDINNSKVSSANNARAIQEKDEEIRVLQMRLESAQSRQGATAGAADVGLKKQNDELLKQLNALKNELTKAKAKGEGTKCCAIF